MKLDHIHGSTNKYDENVMNKNPRFISTWNQSYEFSTTVPCLAFSDINIYWNIYNSGTVTDITPDITNLLPQTGIDICS